MAVFLKLGYMQRVDLCSDVEMDEADGDQVSALRLQEVAHLRGCLGEKRDMFFVAAKTNGDGACALHSLWGSISVCDEDSDWFSVAAPRFELEQKLPQHVVVCLQPCSGWDRRFPAGELQRGTTEIRIG